MKKLSFVLVSLCVLFVLGSLYLNRSRADFCFNQAAKNDYCSTETVYKCSDVMFEKACPSMKEKEIYAEFFACAPAPASNKNCNPTGSQAVCWGSWKCYWDDGAGKCKVDFFDASFGYKGTYKTDDCK